MSKRDCKTIAACPALPSNLQHTTNTRDVRKVIGAQSTTSLGAATSYDKLQLCLRADASSTNKGTRCAS